MELSASMMCARFENLQQEVQLLDQGGIDSFHLDIMDGVFVSNFGMGLQDVQCIRCLTQKPLEAHLMVHRPEPYLRLLDKTLVDTVYIYPERDLNPFAALIKIKESGMRAGITVDPSTSVETIYELLNIVDKVVVLTVNPGHAGQTFLPYVDEKILRLLQLKPKFCFDLMLDGACTQERICTYAPLGVDGFVLGTSLLFGHTESYAEQIAAARSFAGLGGLK